MLNDVISDSEPSGDLTKKIRFTNAFSTKRNSVPKPVRNKFTKHPTRMQKKKSSPLHVHFRDRHAHCVRDPPKDDAIPDRYKVEAFN